MFPSSGNDYKESQESIISKSPATEMLRNNKIMTPQQQISTASSSAAAEGNQQYNRNVADAYSTIVASRGGLGAADKNTLPSVGSLYFFGYSNFENFNGMDLLTFVKEHNATLNFPQKLMLLLTHVERECSKAGKSIDRACVSWIRDGRAFIIRDKETLTKKILPLFFREGKFPSFTRKLYRWGFRQTTIAQGNGIDLNNESSSCGSSTRGGVGASSSSSKKKEEMIFGHEFFQRDNKSLMTNMRSITAAGTRRALAASGNDRKENNLASKYPRAPASILDDQAVSPKCAVNSFSTMPSSTSTGNISCNPGSAPNPVSNGAQLAPVLFSSNQNGLSSAHVPPPGSSIDPLTWQALMARQTTLASQDFIPTATAGINSNSQNIQFNHGNDFSNREVGGRFSTLQGASARMTINNSDIDNLHELVDVSSSARNGSVAATTPNISIAATADIPNGHSTAQLRQFLTSDCLNTDQQGETSGGGAGTNTANTTSAINLPAGALPTSMSCIPQVYLDVSSYHPVAATSSLLYRHHQAQQHLANNNSAFLLFGTNQLPKIDSASSSSTTATSTPASSTTTTNLRMHEAADLFLRFAASSSQQPS